MHCLFILHNVSGALDLEVLYTKSGLDSPAHLEDDSPYPEVRSAVPNTDDPDMPCNTIRVWILGMIMAVIIPGLNQFLCVLYANYSAVV